MASYGQKDNAALLHEMYDLEIERLQRQIQENQSSNVPLINIEDNQNQIRSNQRRNKRSPSFNSNFNNNLTQNDPIFPVNPQQSEYRPQINPNRSPLIDLPIMEDGSKKIKELQEGIEQLKLLYGNGVDANNTNNEDNPNNENSTGNNNQTNFKQKSKNRRRYNRGRNNNYNNNNNNRQAQQDDNNKSESNNKFHQNNMPYSHRGHHSRIIKPKTFTDHPILKNIDLYSNKTNIVCLICSFKIKTNDGIVLGKCGHTFCIGCLEKIVKDSVAENIICPILTGNVPCKNLLKKLENFKKPVKTDVGKIDCPNEKLTSNKDQGAVPKRNASIHPSLDNLPLSLNRIEIECEKCFKKMQPSKGVLIQNCMHKFCIKCIVDSVVSDEKKNMNIICPFEDERGRCKNILKKNKINVPPESFKCMNTNCKKILFVHRYYKKSSIIICPDCKTENCSDCKAIHFQMSCDEYKKKLTYDCLHCLSKMNPNSLEICTKCFRNKNQKISVNVKPVEKLILTPKKVVVVEKLKDNWKCLYCTFVNKGNQLNCNVCKKRKDFVIDENGKMKKYEEHLKLEKVDAVINNEDVFCYFCKTITGKGNGFILKNCLHGFCKKCITTFITKNREPEVKCPHTINGLTCNVALEEREIRGIVPHEIFNAYQSRSRQFAMKATDGFFCKTPKCDGYWIYTDKSLPYKCPVCKVYNCVACEAIHTGKTCDEYKKRDLYKQYNQLFVGYAFNRIEDEIPDDIVHVETCPKCKKFLIKDKTHDCPKESSFTKFFESIFSKKK